MTRRAPLTLDDPRMITIRRYTDGAIDSLQAASRLGMTRRAFNRLVEAARKIDPSLPKRGASDFRLRTEDREYEDQRKRETDLARRAEPEIDRHAHYLAQGFDEALARSLARLASWQSPTTRVEEGPLRIVPPGRIASPRVDEAAA